MNRIDLIQAHINKYGYTNYLEVGVQAGHCFRAIECANKTGVDPDTGSAATIHKTSDEFFAENENKFDVIFIDGLHEAPQVEKDILNAIACLVEGGTILMHDCKPTTEFMQRIPLTTQMEWTGDCWKAFVKCRQDLIATHSFRCVDTDWGVGIIRKLNEGEVNPEFKVTVPLTYENFVANQRDWLNLVPVHYFQP